MTEMEDSKMELNFLDEVLVYSHKNNGGTFDCHREGVCEFYKGYFVGKAGFEKKISELTYEELLTYVNKNRLDESNGSYLGVWENDGYWILDVAVWFLNYQAAKDWGLHWKQKAIYDCENKKEILL